LSQRKLSTKFEKRRKISCQEAKTVKITIKNDMIRKYFDTFLVKTEVNQNPLRILFR